MALRGAIEHPGKVPVSALFVPLAAVEQFDKIIEELRDKPAA